MDHKSAESVRREFQDFFQERGHRQVPSAPVFPQDDPTLLFTNAGMNQFKDVFLGTGKRDYLRATDTQKCIRVSGKHNDLEEVGVDTYHHTFFEMLGNWSFGDYFKEEAILWAWELLTVVWKLPKERLWVSVFGGDEKFGVGPDVEAERIWLEKTDIDPSHVLRFGKEDNFWEMGETGPCGPCSEIHIDRGGADSNPMDGADLKLGVNAGNERFIELWNLVFMQFNRMDDGSLVNLPAKHVDTGMGFERIVSVLQGKHSNYDTDVFTPIFRCIEEITGQSYGAADSPSDVAFRVLADHMRAVSVAFADGALPSNVSRGYVLRRLIRRASRYGRQELGMQDPFLFRIVPAVADTLGVAFSEIGARMEHIQLLIRSEEESFGNTLGRGLVHFEQLAKEVEAAGNRVIPGERAYDLYATYGFPQDLVELMARERSLDVDEAGWNAARGEHQAASRSEGGFKQLLSAEELTGLSTTISTYHGVDETALSIETQVQRWVQRDIQDADEARDVLVLDQSPFYAESGGQVGDTGWIESLDGSFRFRVRDTQKLGALVLHIGESEGSIQERGAVIARVDGDRRAAIQRNHSATHFLHRALRMVLGEHVSQQGSYVGPDRLRFDLSHPSAIDAEHIEAIEAIVQNQICANHAVQTTLEDLDAAKARGVTALFGEKYDEEVRVVDIGGWSTELCGGIHVTRGGDIGCFVISSEGAIQAGVRRIEALTGAAALAHLQHQRRLLNTAARGLKASPEELSARIEDLQKKVKAAKKAAAQSSKADVEDAFDTLKGLLSEEQGLLTGVADLAVGQSALRDLGTRIKSLSPDLAVVLVGQDGAKVPWMALCQGKALEMGLDARKVPDFLRPFVGGGGGGRPDSTQGQGQNAKGRSELILALKQAGLAAYQK